MSKIFVDTNILVYAFDHADPKRMKSARHSLKSLEENNNGVLSTQVMQEFYVSMVQKLKADPLFVKEIIRSFRNFETVQVSSDLIDQAIDCSILKKYSFWDSLIIVCAEQAHCEILWTEDLHHNQTVRGVKIINPFN